MAIKKGVHGPLAKSRNSPPPELHYDPPPNEGLEVLHCDEDVLILSKPAGLLSVAGNQAHLKDCLEARAREEFPTAQSVHRLDRATSGVFVMALNPNSHRNLGAQFERRQTRKTYIAVVAGIPGFEEGYVDQPLRTDWYNRPLQMVDTCLGREALTWWQVLDQQKDEARIQLNPVTGRSHQLRVHMQWLGHPILGDEFYASPETRERSNRLLLHAERLEMYHPKTGQRIGFTSVCPF